MVVMCELANSLVELIPFFQPGCVGGAIASVSAQSLKLTVDVTEELRAVTCSGRRVRERVGGEGDAARRQVQRVGDNTLRLWRQMGYRQLLEAPGRDALREQLDHRHTAWSDLRHSAWSWHRVDVAEVRAAHAHGRHKPKSSPVCSAARHGE